MAVLAGTELVLAACSSGSPAPTALSIDEYFQRVQAWHGTKERQREAIRQRLAGQLSGDETNVEEVLAAPEEFVPEFRAVLSETREGLAQITPPPVAGFEIPDSESQRGFDALDTHFGGFGAQREAEGSWGYR